MQWFFLIPKKPHFWSILALFDTETSKQEFSQNISVKLILSLYAAIILCKKSEKFLSIDVSKNLENLILQWFWTLSP